MNMKINIKDTGLAKIAKMPNDTEMRWGNRQAKNYLRNENIIAMQVNTINPSRPKRR